MSDVSTLRRALDRDLGMLTKHMNKGISTWRKWAAFQNPNWEKLDKMDILDAERCQNELNHIKDKLAQLEELIDMRNTRKMNLQYLNATTETIKRYQRLLDQVMVR